METLPDPAAPSASAAASDIAREEIHFRQIDMRAYRRSDGLFEVVGRIIDRKPLELPPLPHGRFVAANQPIHNMGVRLIYDEHLVVRIIETFTDAAPYFECPEGGRSLQAMVGVSMGRGWSREVRTRLDSSGSCTHLRELLIPLATTAYQALAVVRRNRPVPADASGRPLQIDSCYAYRAEGELVKLRWPTHHRPKADGT